MRDGDQDKRAKKGGVKDGLAAGEKIIRALKPFEDSEKIRILRLVVQWLELDVCVTDNIPVMSGPEYGGV